MQSWPEDTKTTEWAAWRGPGATADQPARPPALPGSYYQVSCPSDCFLTWKFFFHLFSKQTWVLFDIWALTCGLDVIFYRLPKFFSSLLIKTNAVNFTFLAQNVNKKLPAWYFVDPVVAFLFINFFLLTTIEICLKVTRKFLYFGATVM